MKLYWIFLLYFILLSCSKENNVISTKENPTILQIQPFTDIAKDDVTEVVNQLKKKYPHIEVLPAIDFPESAFYKPRNRYRADSIIKFLKNNTPNGIVKVGLTSKDISATKGNNKDFGIMGLGYKPGKSCVASSFRLSKKNKNEQHFKVAIHEIGHTQGLSHCPNFTCYMRDAEAQNHNDDLIDFCNDCKKFLTEKRNWKF